ncbi:MAG: hypothetical protein IJ202_02935 [Bacteroidales bacterium]|jgi:hypothetical protein|nr:hypothetical protein [Bacteroidales bacterium]MBQ9173668.1 hypothetical protein [Bacteroidales bacterium]MBR1434864.1 hypothetical protein [Bacteroidales bacterium]
MFSFFFNGGIGVMSILTLLLIALFFAAWKAPAWVKEIGLAALAISLLSVLIGCYSMFDTLRQVEGSISPGVLFSVLRNASISLIYGVSVYIISLVVRIVLKPRIG